MCLHTKVPLVALLCLVHLGVMLGAILGRAGCGHQDGAHHRAGLGQQTALNQLGVVGRQNLRGDFVRFQLVKKAQHGAQYECSHPAGSSDRMCKSQRKG